MTLEDAFNLPMTDALRDQALDSLIDESTPVDVAAHMVMLPHTGLTLRQFLDGCTAAFEATLLTINASIDAKDVQLAALDRQEAFRRVFRSLRTSKTRH
jgi:hypothetical protein